MKQLPIAFLILLSSNSASAQIKEVLNGFLRMNMDTTNWLWDTTKVTEYFGVFEKGWKCKMEFNQYADYFDKNQVLIGAEDSNHLVFAPYACTKEQALIYMCEMLRVNGIQLQYYSPKEISQEENFNSLFGNELPGETLCYLDQHEMSTLAGVRTNRGILFIQFYQNKKKKIYEVEFLDPKGLLTKSIYPFNSKPF